MASTWPSRRRCSIKSRPRGSVSWMRRKRHATTSICAPGSPATEPAKKEPPLQPQPETAKLLESAHEAIKKKNVKEAIELLEKYLDDPAAPEPKEALLLWDWLRTISSEDFMLRQLAKMSEEELLRFEQGK